MSEKYTGAAPGTAEERRRARTRKKLLALCAGIAAVAVLAAAVLVLNAVQKAQENAQETSGITLDVLPASGSIDSMSFFAKTGETVTLQRSGDGWQWVQQPDFPVDAEPVQTMCEVLAMLSPEEHFTAQSSGDYGFAEPVQVITLSDGSSTRTLTVGAKNGVTGNYYLQVDDGTGLYTVTEHFVTMFDADMMEMMVYEPMPDMTNALITGIRVQAPGAQPLAITPYDTDAETGQPLWQAVQGEASEKVDPATATTILDRLHRLTYAAAAAWKPTEAQLAEWQLDEASRTVISIDYTLVDEQGVAVTDTLTLYVGAVEGNMNRRYAAAPGQKGVYQISGAQVEGLLTATPADLATVIDAAQGE